MIISDLQYIEPVSNDITLFGRAGTTVAVLSSASGDSSHTNVLFIMNVKQLLNNGSIATGTAKGFAIASDPIDATARVDVSGDAQGDIRVVYTYSNSSDNGNQAEASGTVVAMAITFPK